MTVPTSPVLRKRPLTLRESRFVAELPRDFNATQAAIRAGYSEKSAHVIASHMLDKPHIAAAVAAALEERNARTKVTTTWVVTELRELYASSLRDGKRVVATRCLELLARHAGGFAEQHEVSGPQGGPIEVATLSDTERATRIAEILATAKARKEREA